MKTLYLSLAAMLLWSSAMPAADVQFVVNPSVGQDSLSADELKRIFMGTKSAFGDGTHAEPILASGGAAHDAFLKQVGKTDVALRTYYKSLVFTGKGSMPKSGSSDADVIALVSKTKGGIGYVAGGSTPAGVKVIAVK